MKSRAEVEDAANSLRALAGELTAPIDPFRVAHALGARVVVKNFSDDLSGLLVRKGDAATIAISASDGPLRQRFTVAHECGHLKLGHVGEVFIDKQVINRRDGNSSLAIDEQEIEANQFAASLLMPRDQVVAYLDQLVQVHKQRGVLIELVANKFRVSKPAMEFRLVNLGLIASPPED
ncbi:MAG: ImmA/IrrE family metallo-endopeptidase [Rhodoferax sp.]|nr:ImmA/IrrE family metallo-endopeptidase [Rhodoferax sp.]MDP3650337.1 ImmA/IrrE family metallo-endopeptidase [Rhodoferax sp.]